MYHQRLAIRYGKVNAVTELPTVGLQEHQPTVAPTPIAVVAPLSVPLRPAPRPSLELLVVVPPLAPTTGPRPNLGHPAIKVVSLITPSASPESYVPEDPVPLYVPTPRALLAPPSDAVSTTTALLPPPGDAIPTTRALSPPSVAASLPRGPVPPPTLPLPPVDSVPPPRVQLRLSPSSTAGTFCSPPKDVASTSVALVSLPADSALISRSRQRPSTGSLSRVVWPLPIYPVQQEIGALQEALDSVPYFASSPAVILTPKKIIASEPVFLARRPVSPDHLRAFLMTRPPPSHPLAPQ